MTLNNKQKHTGKMLLVIGYGLDSPDTLKRIHDAGINIVFVQTKALLNVKAVACASDIVITDYLAEDFLVLADALHSHWNFFSALSLTETGVVIAATLNIRWGKPSTSLKSLFYLKNKGAMRALLAQHNFSTVRYAECSIGQQALDFVDSQGLPIIIKPIDGGGSMGVRLIDNWKVLIDFAKKIDISSCDYIVEEVIDGPEYSIECFSFDGQHNVITITEKVSVEEFVEVSHMIPARLPPSLEQQVHTFISKFLDIIGLTQGPSHTEFKVSSSGIKIIESHNRPAGGNISKMIKKVFEIDIIQLSALWAVREINSDYLHNKTARGIAIVRFLILPSGRIKKIDGFNEIKSEAIFEILEKKMYYGEGEKIPFLEGNSRRCGYIILYGQEVDNVLTLSSDLMTGIQVEIEED